MSKTGKLTGESRRTHDRRTRPKPAPSDRNCPETRPMTRSVAASISDGTGQSSANCECCKSTLKNACFSQGKVLIFPKSLEELQGLGKNARSETVHQYLTYINCMLNGGGGVLLLHSEDRFLAFFDEQVDKRMLELIPDGTMFDENFSRKTIDDKHHAVVVLNVQGRKLSIMNFHSMISLNKGRDKPNFCQMRHLLSRQPSTHQQESRGEPPPMPSLRENQPIPLFHEDANNQAKIVKDKQVKKAGKTHDSWGTKLFRYCWKDLNLNTFVAAFTKQENGGRYLIGVEEETSEEKKKWKEEETMTQFLTHVGSDKKCWSDVKNPNVLYIADEEDVPVESGGSKTGRYLCRGIELTEQQKKEFEEEFKSHVKRELFWYPNPPENLDTFLSCRFYYVTRADNPPNASGGARGTGKASSTQTTRTNVSRMPLYIIEIYVPHFPGVCFQTKEGPEAYKLLRKDNPKDGFARLSGKDCCSEMKK